MSMYSLTHLTGRKRNADRKVIIATVEVNKATFVISIVAVVASILPTVIAMATFGPPAAVLVPALFIGAGYFLFRYRAQKGLQMPMYKLLMDKSSVKRMRGQILVCGVPVQEHASIGQLTRSSVEADRFNAQSLDLFNDNDHTNTDLAPAHGVTAAYDGPATRHDLLD